MLAIVMLMSLAAIASAKDYSGTTIHIYSNSNSTERIKAHFGRSAPDTPAAPQEAN